MSKEIAVDEVRELSDGTKVKAVLATDFCKGCVNCKNIPDDEIGSCDSQVREDRKDIIFVEVKDA